MGHAASRPIVLVLVALLATAFSPSAQATTLCAADQYVESFDIVAEPRQEAYRIGETALVDMRVTNSFTGTPAQDIDAGIFIEGKRDKIVLDASKTDEDGRASLRLQLKRSHVGRGWARAMAGAWESINTAVYCTGRYGYREYPKLFRIRP